MNVKYDDFTKQTSIKDNISTFNPEDDFFQSQRFRFNQTIPLPDLPKGEKIIKNLGDIEVSYFSTAISRGNSEVNLDFFITLKNKGATEEVINFLPLNKLKEGMPQCSSEHGTLMFAYQDPPIKIPPYSEKKIWYFISRNEDDCDFILDFKIWLGNDSSGNLILPIEIGYSNESFKGKETSMIYGYIRDEYGNPISNPYIRAEMNCGGLDYTGFSDENGKYVIPLLGMEDINAIYGQKELECESKDYSIFVEKEGYEYYFYPHLAPTRKEPINFNITLQKKKDNIYYSLEWEKQVNEPYGFFWIKPSEDWDVFAASQAKHPPELNQPTNIYLFSSNGSIIWKYPVGAECWGLDITKDGQVVGAGCHDSYVYVINRDGSLRWKKYCGYTTNREVKFSNDGTKLVTGPIEEHDAVVYNVVDDSPLVELSGVRQPLRNAVFSINDDKFVIGKAFGYLEMHSINGDLLWSNFIGEFPMFLAIDPKDNVFAGGKSHMLFSFDSEGKMRWKYRLMGTALYGAISKDGSKIIVGAEKLYFFDGNGSLLWKRRTLEKGPNIAPVGHNAITMTPDGKYIIVGTAETNCVIVYNNNGTLLWSQCDKVDKSSSEMIPGVTNVQISNDGKYIIASYGDNYIRKFVRQEH